MFILDQYIELWIAYGKGKKEGEQLEITVQNISETLFCTERNSKLIIKKLEELRWIVWFPGRGRGNRSKLIFQKQPMTLILNRGKELTKKGDVKSGISFVERYSAQFPSVKKEYEVWVDSIFGHQIERTPEGRKDVLRLQVQMNLDIALDPVYATMRSECHMVKHIFDTLVYINEETNSIEPRLSFQWEYNDAEKIWTFYLRKGVHFHNRKQLTAHDVIHSLNRFMKTENNPHAWMLQHVESFRAVDEFVVEIQLHTENRMFLHMLSAEQCSIVKEDEAGNFIGTGPFSLREKNANLFVLEAHDLYYRERPFLDRIELLNVKRSVNTYDVLVKAQYKDKEKHNKELSRLESNVTYITCNLAKEGPMQDYMFRKALYKIIHGHAIVKELGGERGEVAKKLILANESIVDIDEDIQSLIKRSTYHSEVLQLYTFTGRDHVEDAQWIQKECAKYGIRVETNFLEIEDLLEISTIQKADMMHDSATIGERIEDSLLYMFLTKNSFIHGQSSVDFHKSLSPYFKQEQVEKRVALLRDIEETLLRQIQIIPLYRNKQQVISHEKVQNIMINSQGWIDFYRIWFKP
ncbi:ABC transporter substrate-binding protein [Bacillus paranthracis]|uniref:ABC transporter substrate-binding protein n=1 Tax=Bacillus TaxID=1386 RepID=UPI000200F484|nr:MULTISPECIES: SgrR family transcriptional regulator [Bacillus]ADY22113.1 oligopeptide ABC transporter oligopeptide-binding protein [Bacillus thuringiensis serovar finitimus YBT-020]MRC72297.1 SgrR family transcriptional regulator [Bacillus thuringiensis]OTX69916.1 peptide-binding protein [Bacillus thuringiensis serovar finitimus]MCR6797684.1 SgrR family transcriptional regulator [Bacillus paranthracis]MEC3355541.1 ABC transporter substrate-binding protein [Bacillus paranthracis]